MKKIFLFLSLITLSSFALVESQNAFAYYDIGIRLDKTCQALIDAGDLWTCPTPEQIEQVFPQMKLLPQYQKLVDEEQDKADIITNNGYIEKYSRSCIKFEQCSIFEVDPIQKVHYWHNPSELLERSMDVITIQPNMKIKNPTYLKYEDVTIFTKDNKRQINFEINQLYISPNCKDAVFNPHFDWRSELGYLIYYMSKGCNNANLISKVFDLNHIEETTVSEYDPLTSPNYLARIQMEQDIARCKVKC